MALSPEQASAYADFRRKRGASEAQVRLELEKIGIHHDLLREREDVAAAAAQKEATGEIESAMLGIASPFSKVIAPPVRGVVN